MDKTFVYITVIATNAAGLQTIAYSDPVLVDLTPPIFDYVYDGTGKNCVWNLKDLRILILY